MKKMLPVYLFFKDAICSCATCYDTLHARETTFVFAYFSKFSTNRGNCNFDVSCHSKVDDACTTRL